MREDETIIDVPMLMERFEGDEDLVREIWEAFVEDAPCQLRLLKDALEMSDAQLAAMQAHSLKGAAGNVGAELLQDKAAGLEQAARANTQGVGAMYDGVAFEVERAVDALTALIARESIAC